MHEASKTNKIRGPDFVRRYFQERSVIDIGCGDDPVVPWAEPFDRADGDANLITEYLPGRSFDVVHSSHCLEHMRVPREALAQWWALVRPGGFLITVVPDEELYEQGIWPSVFNYDHKWAFTLDPRRLWGAHVIDLQALHLQLPGVALVDVQKHEIAYRRELMQATRDNLSARNFARYRRAIAGLRRCKLGWLGLDMLAWPWLTRHGVLVDQTRTAAMAQLQIIVQKRPVA
jgi:SAM-dependent methyltransferase